VARETKLGLVVGLGFIICFAIIVSNRGAAQGPSLRQPYRAEPGFDDVSAPIVAGSAERQARALGGFGDVRRSRPTERGGTMGGGGDERNSLWGSGGPERAQPNEFEEPASSTEPALAAPVADAAADPDAEAAELRHGAQSLIATTPNEATEGLERALRAAGLDVAAPAARGVEPAAPRPASGVRRHVVSRGDTLWKIAELHYGVKSKAVVDAIFEANRGLLKDPKVLLVGQELILPGLNEPMATTESHHLAAPTQPPAAAPSEPAENPAPKDPPPRRNGRGFRWYQVKNGDRYASIAREQLGSRNRWSEIYELNKDIFPDPAKIRSGVKIRIPDGGT